MLLTECFGCGKPAREHNSNYCEPCLRLLIDSIGEDYVPAEQALDWMRYNGFLAVRV